MRRHSGVATYRDRCVPRRLLHVSLVRDGPRADALAPATRPAPAHSPSTIDRLLVPRHSVVGTYSNTLCVATCMICIGSERRAAGRRFGAGHETCTGIYSLNIDRLLVHRHSVVGTYSSTLCLTTCIIYIAIHSEGRAEGRRLGAGPFKQKSAMGSRIPGMHQVYAGTWEYGYPFLGAACLGGNKKPGTCMCPYSTYALRSGVISVFPSNAKYRVLCLRVCISIPGHGFLRIYHLVQKILPSAPV